MLRKLTAWIKENIVSDGTDKDFGSQDQIKNDAYRLLGENEATRHVDTTVWERVIDRTVQVLTELDVPTAPYNVQDFLLSDLVLPVAINVLTRIATSEYERDEQEKNELIRASLDAALHSPPRQSQNADTDKTD